MVNNRPNVHMITLSPRMVFRWGKHDEYVMYPTGNINPDRYITKANIPKACKRILYVCIYNAN